MNQNIELNKLLTMQPRNMKRYQMYKRYKKYRGTAKMFQNIKFK